MKLAALSYLIGLILVLQPSAVRAEDEPKLHFIETNGIRMRVAEMGSGPLVVMLHGFPESWYSWRHQLPALAKAGYRAVAPDMRGYGRTAAPKGVEKYDIIHLTDDVVGILDALGEKSAVVIGHDWGASVAWDCAALHPDRFRAVLNLANPYSGRGSKDVPPIWNLNRIAKDNFFYILYFQEADAPEAELDKDPRESLLRIYGTSFDVAHEAPEVIDPKRSAGGLLPRIAKPKELPGWFTSEDLNYYATEFKRTGFGGGINWYRNIDRNWGLTSIFAGKKLPQPFFFIAGAKDQNLWGQGSGQLLKRFSRDAAAFRGIKLFPDGDHFINQSKPEETNRLIVAFLKSLDSVPPPSNPKGGGKE